jgi:hypothetical protein
MMEAVGLPTLSGTFGLAAITLMAASACGTPSAPADPVSANSAIAADREGGTVANQAPINERFRSLDEYLAFLERTQAPVDGPWYREIRPGVFELMTGNLRVVGAIGEPQQPQKQIFTREELARKYGFAE